METILRKPFQGISNIVRFNWHFYLLASIAIAVLLFSSIVIQKEFAWMVTTTAILILVTTILSLAVSFYVYDYSSLYSFKWFKFLPLKSGSKIVNIHAGFDETSLILKVKYPRADLTVLDFYDPTKHTEVSIKRARKALPAYDGTKQITTDHIPLVDKSIDLIFNIFSIHEVRDSEERIRFLRNQNAALKDDGRCVIVEHLRDVANFAAYNIGFFHFVSLRQWKCNFSKAGFEIETVFKITPFVSVFILNKKNGSAP